MPNFLLSIEGNPFIIRFKTVCYLFNVLHHFGIEGNPFIIRFKTDLDYDRNDRRDSYGIEGNPFIIRFKTKSSGLTFSLNTSIEGNPFIIRFKTCKNFLLSPFPNTVLKVIHL